MLRTGYWPHRAIFDHFGIKEGGELAFGTLEFYKAWNAQMDLLLLEKYGREYDKYRKMVLPPRGASPNEVVGKLMQPSGGY